MRPFIGRPDIEVDGQWYFCLEGAKPLPFMHSFASQNWDPSTHMIEPAIGEVRGRQGYVKDPTPATLDGLHFCGPQTAWQNGVPLSERGQPIIGPDGKECSCPISNCILQEDGGHLLLEDGDGCISPENA